tara:strand:- start:108 stop:332 length:225 start_codon:yes stop_codon:yes gene_type:complete
MAALAESSSVSRTNALAADDALRQCVFIDLVVTIIVQPVTYVGAIAVDGVLDAALAIGITDSPRGAEVAAFAIG